MEEVIQETTILSLNATGNDSSADARATLNKRRDAKIVYIHHGSFVGGGASISLINTLRWMKKYSAFELILWCPYAVVNRYVASHIGIRTFRMPMPPKILGKVLIGWAYWHRLQTFRLMLRDIVQLPFNVASQLRHLYAERPDLVHLNSSILVASAIAARILGIPIVWHIREVNLGGRVNLRRRFMGWLMRRLADVVIAISPVEAASIDGTGSNNVKVVYNYIDFDAFALDAFDIEKIKADLKLGGESGVVITLGGSTSFRKGIVPLLESMEFFDNRTSLIILGPKYHEQRLKWFQRLHRSAVLWVEDLFVSMGITGAPYRHYDYRVSQTVKRLSGRIDMDRIIWVGEVPDVAPYLAVSDLLVFAGMTPHFPRPIYEAWAMKKPVVAFDVDGIRQNIDQGVDGVLVKKNDAKALGRAIDDLLKDKGKREKVGANGMQKSSRLFRIDNNMKKIISIYNSLLSRASDEDG